MDDNSSKCSWRMRVIVLRIGRMDGNSEVLNNYPDKFTVKYCAQMHGKEGEEALTSVLWRP
jgi:hypothetical protein